MKCPHCGSEHDSVNGMFDTPVIEWLDSYGRSANSITTCCGKVVLIGTLTTYHVRASDDTEDDWGNEVISK